MKITRSKLLTTFFCCVFVLVFGSINADVFADCITQCPDPSQPSCPVECKVCLACNDTDGIEPHDYLPECILSGCAAWERIENPFSGDININSDDDDDGNPAYMINGKRVLAGNGKALSIGESGNNDLVVDTPTGYILMGNNVGSALDIAGGTVIIGNNAANKLQSSYHNTYIGAAVNGGAEFNPDAPGTAPSYNTIVGSLAGYHNIGWFNVFIGSEAGESVTTGNENILIGQNAGSGHYRGDNVCDADPEVRPYKDCAIRTGDNNIHIGAQTEAVSDDLSSTLAIGNRVVVEKDNQMVFGSNLFYWEGYAYKCSVSKYACDPTIIDVCGDVGGTCELSDKLIKDYTAECDYATHVTTICEENDYGSYTESYWGAGVSADWDEDFSHNGVTREPKHFRFNATGGKGEDRRGADLMIAGGKSTGSSEGGSIKLQTSSPARNSGTTRNDLVDRLTIDSNGSIQIGVVSGNENYESLTITHDDNSGGGFYTQRTGHDPFVTMSGWDYGNGYGLGRVLYFGGGGWGVDDTNTIIFYTDQDYDGAHNEGKARMVINNSGNIGINSTNPQSKLHVNGYVQLATVSGSPPANECNEETYGRMIVEPNGDGALYICVQNGWRKTNLSP